MKNFVIGLSVLLMAGLAQGADTKIGFVDMQKAVQSSAAGKKAKSDLETEFNKKKKDLEKQEAELKKMNEDLQRKKSVLSEDAFGKKQAAFQEEMMKYRDVMGKSQADIEKKQRELMAPILEKMKGVIAKIAKEKSYTLVLENSQMVLFATPDADLTDEVIKAVDK